MSDAGMARPDIRPLAAADLPVGRAVIASTGLFPAELLDGMAAAFLAGEADEVWRVADLAGQAAAIAYAAPERMTDGTWNLLLIAVRTEAQGQGLGGALTREVEQAVAARGARILLVETSGLPAFERTRGVYRRLGYAEEARIRDYYAAGDDKVVFRKALMRAGLAA
jgi:ribosomal protein S18 acetylase RimI-like enzyme